MNNSPTRLYVCLCVHGTAEPVDGVAELPDTQTSQQTDMNETYYVTASNRHEHRSLYYCRIDLTVS